MGVKMEWARDQNGRNWKAGDYQKGMGREPLLCEHCSAKIGHCPDYVSRILEEKQRRTPAYFRLQRAEEHESHCSFGVKEAITKIVSESKQLFEKDESGRYRFRLMMVKEALTGASSASSDADEEDAAVTPSRRATSYQKSSNKLPSYINSAKRVLMLRAKCDSDAEMKANLELVFQGNTIVPWNLFYFETDRHMAAFHTVQDNTIEHPIAVHGFLKPPKTNLKGIKTSNVLNLQIGKRKTDPNDRDNCLSVEVSIWSHKPDWFKGLKEDDEVIVLGLWKASREEPRASSREGRYKTFQTYRLSLNLSLQAQITKL
jgi:hypothetical protein